MSKKIMIILGSKTDLENLEEEIKILKELGVDYHLEIISAHRNPEKLRRLCREIEKNKKVEVIIACAGKAAALPGFVASYVNIPVIGVALKGGLLDGLDALFSIVSIPKGLGLVCSGIGRSAFINALIFSLQILSLKDKTYFSKLEILKKKFKR
jgi:5-(carboxyamino)imidazole ribonucleotide mutase